MIKHLLRITMIFSAIILSVGMIEGSEEYVETGAKGLLICSWVGVALWIPLLVLIVKYLTEKDE